MRSAQFYKSFLVVAFLLFTASFLYVGCKNRAKSGAGADEIQLLAKDHHSFSKPNQIRIKHISLDLSVDFERNVLSGSATYTLLHVDTSQILHLDASNLNISKVVLASGKEVSFLLSESVKYFGQDMAIFVPLDEDELTIYYETKPDAEAIMWLTAQQTDGGKHPFMFTQSQAILARTWVPCQDSPGVKFTYDAKISVPPGLLALMSAENGTEKTADGKYTFKMDQPISSYLLALTVGDLEYISLGQDCGVFAEPTTVKSAAWEFADMQRMIDSAAALYGPYAWGKYDVVILPPSFPFGGMENPRLTFATPTILAGDRSLVALIAHELAHSWSGNLVTNETWDDFWLNEGFTVYFEQRIMEKIFGVAYSEMQTKLGMGDLQRTIAKLTAEGRIEDTHLYLDLKGKNPDDGLTDIAYEKGRFFLQTIERNVGRPAFDDFLKTYFDVNKFKAMNTKRFLGYLDQNLLKGDSALYAAIDPSAWAYGPGLPSNVKMPESSELDRVEVQIQRFKKGASTAPELDTS
ncbi:MAG: leukotriene-A4 hydrolase, partial [Bacteroidia bacterium]